MRHSLAAISLLLVLLTACNNNPLQPRSGGRLYETLVVGDTNHIVSSTLGTEIPALPQSEPAFDVSNVTHNGFNNTLQLSRNIVITNIDSVRYPTTKITYQKDEAKKELSPTPDSTFTKLWFNYVKFVVPFIILAIFISNLI